MENVRVQESQNTWQKGGRVDYAGFCLSSASKSNNILFIKFDVIDRTVHKWNIMIYYHCDSHIIRFNLYCKNYQ